VVKTLTGKVKGMPLKMEYNDHKVIELRMRHKRETSLDLEQGVSINGERLNFQRQLLFDEQLSILLPETFQIMSVEIAKIKYPSEQRPQLIYTNSDGSVNYTFSLLDVPVDQSQLTEIRDGFKNIIKRIQPANIFYQEQEETLGDTVVAQFDFKNYGIDTQLYNLFYFTVLAGKLIHGIFNCPFQERDTWQPIAQQVIKSMLIEKQK